MVILRSISLIRTMQSDCKPIVFSILKIVVRLVVNFYWKNFIAFSFGDEFYGIFCRKFGI